MKNLAVIFSLTALTLFGFSCAKKDDNKVVTYQLNQMGQCVDSQNGTIVNPTLCSNGYQLNQYGQCVQTSTGQIAQTYLCQQGGMNGYQLNQYGQCVQTSTGQIVQTYLCQQGGMNSCVGLHMTMNGGQIYCSLNNGYNNCRGMQLYSASTGQQVFCQ